MDVAGEGDGQDGTRYKQASVASILIFYDQQHKYRNIIKEFKERRNNMEVIGRQRVEVRKQVR
jgi:hypothetical protein